MNLRIRTTGGRSGGFTLVELLVVVMIILVLAGLLFPALIWSMRRARDARAKSEARDLSKAWESYFDAYDKYTLGSTIDMNSNNVAVLAGRDSSLNSNYVAFMEFSRTEEAKGMLDPWKCLYRVKYSDVLIKRDNTYSTRAYMANKKRYQYDQ